MSSNLDPVILDDLVRRYDDDEQPLRPEELTDELDADREDIADCLEELEANDLLASLEDGYRPTVTVRELLELDIDFEETFVVLDIDPHDCDASGE